MQHRRDTAKFGVDGELHTALDAAAAEIGAMPASEQRTIALRGLAALLLDAPNTVRSSAVQRCPDLETTEPIPDSYLGLEEQEMAARLPSTDLDVIDAALIAATVETWRKMSRVIGDALFTSQSKFPGLPLGVYVQRVQALVQEGVLLAQGDVQFMRHSEIRLPQKDSSAA